MLVQLILNLLLVCVVILEHLRTFITVVLERVSYISEQNEGIFGIHLIYLCSNFIWEIFQPTGF